VSLTGVGAFSAVTLGFFDRLRRDYIYRVMQAEVVSLIASRAHAVLPACLLFDLGPGQH
jgi:hypothetical protein